MSLKIIYVEDGFRADLSLAEVPHSAEVGPLPDTVVGGMSVWDLREQKNVVIPEGAERIGSYWFCGSNVESVTVPASVRELGIDVLCDCKKLKRVTFAEGSRLEKLDTGCFANSGLEKIVIPKGVEEF